jgi:DNA-3-methyladenine glycosylase
VVTESEGSPAAVLIRALEPLEGLALMRKRRLRARTARHPAAPGPHASQPNSSPPHASRPQASRRISDLDLCKGPGNVTHALGISLRQNRLDLVGGELYIEDRGMQVEEIRWSPRIGITRGVERHWRCFVAASTSVSGSRPKPKA